MENTMIILLWAALMLSFWAVASLVTVLAGISMEAAVVLVVGSACFLQIIRKK